MSIKRYDPRVTVDKATRYAGGTQKQLAALLGVTKQAVHQWAQKTGYLPALQAYRFQALKAQRSKRGKQCR